MRKLLIRLLPVGRGDCVLIRFPDDSWGVVDCGQKRGIYEPYTQAATLLNNESPTDAPVRFILATHPHADHDGGVLQLMEQLGQRSVHSVFFCGIERRASECCKGHVVDDGQYSFVEEGRRRVRSGQLRECKTLKAPATISLEPPIEDLSVRVLWPTGRLVSGVKKRNIAHLGSEAVNNLSVTLRIDYLGSSILLLGDLDGRVCAKLVGGGRKGAAIRVIKAPHHGGEGSRIPWKSIPEAPSSGVILVSCPTGSVDYPHAEFLKSVPAAKWIIRCTGLAGGCVSSQPAERWPIRGDGSSLPESLIRSLLSIGGRYRFPRIHEHEGCNLDNVVVLDADGELTHSSRSRFCDTSRDFTSARLPRRG
jgi:hypothetical protein